MKSKLIFWVLCLFCFAIGSCKHKISHVIPAYYYWKNGRYGLSDREKDAITHDSVQNVCVKYFEVSYNDAMGAFPTAKSDFSARYFSDYCNKDSFKGNIIPTVFIKNYYCPVNAISGLKLGVQFFIRKIAPHWFIL